MLTAEACCRPQGKRGNRSTKQKLRKQARQEKVGCCVVLASCK